MESTYEMDKYLTVTQVAELKGVSRQAVFADIKKGRYEGIIQVPMPGSNRKMWLIPKTSLSTAVVTEDVATIKHHLSPAELQRIVSAPLLAELQLVREEMAAMREEQKELVQALQARDDTIKQLIDKVTTPAALPAPEQPKGFLQRLFGG